MDLVPVVLWTITATAAASALYFAHMIKKAIRILEVSIESMKEDYYEHIHE